jgi:hypothetical protein
MIFVRIYCTCCFVKTFHYKNAISNNLNLSIVIDRRFSSASRVVSQYSVWLRAARPGDWGSIPGRGKRIFSCSLYVQSSSGANPASYTMGTGGGGPFPGAKARPGRDADHSPPSSAKIKNRSYTSSSSKRLRGV